MPTARSLALTSTAAAALLLLTGCSQEPLRHGEVIDKEGHAGYWVQEYKNIYRDKCTNIHTSAFTMSLSGRTVGGTGGRSTTTGGGGSKSLTSGGTGKSSSGKTSGSTTGGGTLNKPRTTGGNDGGTTSNSSGSSSGSTKPTKQCQQEYVGRKKTGKRWEPGQYKLKLRDDDRTGWIKVSKHTYDTTDLHDHV
ncbi:hypothetical protein [Streptomyces rhizosphaericus]|uniref:hypothetical protein n=1 Tax=Streptomyces rhizosphaericus TaxID=114699 RepID=UPI000A35F904|nr:hypothetical protein [Streptomyces rhizosphaericus]